MALMHHQQRCTLYWYQKDHDASEDDESMCTKFLHIIYIFLCCADTEHLTPFTHFMNTEMIHISHYYLFPANLFFMCHHSYADYIEAIDVKWMFLLLKRTCDAKNCKEKGRIKYTLSHFIWENVQFFIWSLVTSTIIIIMSSHHVIHDAKNSCCWRRRLVTAG